MSPTLRASLPDLEREDTGPELRIQRHAADPLEVRRFRGAGLLQPDVRGPNPHDATAPGDQTLYYVVQAENDETCSTGPNNGGLTDGNSGHLAVDVTTTRPMPGEIQALRADLIGQAHVRLQWNPVAGAASYRIYRSASPQSGTFTLLAETGTALHEDIGAGPTGDSFYYKVVAVNACGQEGTW